jgi:hypothetical protein
MDRQDSDLWRAVGFSVLFGVVCWGLIVAIVWAATS